MAGTRARGTLGRALVSTWAVSLALALVLPAPASAAVTFGPQREVAANAWTTGSSFAARGGTVLALLTTDVPGGVLATDAGPYMGVYLSTSDDRGQTWSAPDRVSQARRHADRAALAVDGSDVYAVWVAQQSYDDYEPDDPRVLFVRASHDGGRPGSWGRTIQLSPGSGRVDHPSVAAGDGRAYVAWVAARSGEVRVAVSRDEGRTFTRRVVGKTEASSAAGEGRIGLPAVAASGDDVGVAWIASGSGALKVRVSRDGGSTWGNTITLTGSGALANGGSPSASGGEGALAFAWTTGAGVFARVWRGSFGPTRTVASFGSAQLYKGGYDAQIALGPGGNVGLAWSGCRRRGCEVLSANARIDVLYAGSADGGATWSAAEVVRASSFRNQRINDGAGIAWLEPAARLVGYTGYASGYTSYGLFVRVGTGA